MGPWGFEGSKSHIALFVSKQTVVELKVVLLLTPTNGLPT